MLDGIGVLPGRGSGSKSRGREGKRVNTEGDIGERSVAGDFPGFDGGTEGNRGIEGEGGAGFASSSSSIDGNDFGKSTTFGLVILGEDGEEELGEGGPKDEVGMRT